MEGNGLLCADLQVSNSSRVSVWCVSADTRDCLLLMAAGESEEAVRRRRGSGRVRRRLVRKAK